LVPFTKVSYVSQEKVLNFERVNIPNFPPTNDQIFPTLFYLAFLNFRVLSSIRISNFNAGLGGSGLEFVGEFHQVTFSENLKVMWKVTQVNANPHGL
jgi:hypothetical protein